MPKFKYNCVMTNDMNTIYLPDIYFRSTCVSLFLKLYYSIKKSIKILFEKLSLNLVV